MTEIEAKEVLKRDLEIQIENKALPDGIMAMKMAIKSLEMQIPKKMDRYYCPICRHYFEDGEIHNYCPACGQKLENDWG